MNLLACYETCTTAHTLLYCLIGQAVHTAGKRSSNSIWSQETSVLISTTFNITRLYRSEETIFLFKVFKKNHSIRKNRIIIPFRIDRSLSMDSTDKNRDKNCITRKVYQYILVARITYYYFKGLNRSPSFHFSSISICINIGRPIQPDISIRFIDVSRARWHDSLHGH